MDIKSGETVGIVGRNGGSVGASTIDIEQRIHEFIISLFRAGYEVHVDSDTYHFTAPSLDSPKLKVTRIEAMLHPDSHVRALVVFGGDGTMLGVARQTAALSNSIPILGVNHGRVGFITDVPGDSEPYVTADRLLRVLGGENTVEKRTVLQTQFSSKHYSPQVALNDVVINREGGKILEVEVYINEQFAYRSRSDGVMVSTPTGSTAYAMSAGGPILHPSAKVIEIIPMMPQTMSYRPLVVNDDVNVTIKLVKGTAEVYADGAGAGLLLEGSVLDVSKLSTCVNLIHPKLDGVLTYDYYQTLRTKLNWHLEPGRAH